MSKKMNQSVVIELRDPDEGKPKQARLKKRLLVVAPLTGHASGTPEKDPVEVTKRNLEQLAGFRPTLTIEVPNRLTDEAGTKLNLEMTFDSIDDFTPAGIARKAEPLAKLVRVKEALLVLRSKLKDPSVRERLQALLGQSPDELKKLLPAPAEPHQDQ
jgi:type VI secretion system protein ImpB